jgi:hypothetical protein
VLHRFKTQACRGNGTEHRAIVAAVVSNGDIERRENELRRGGQNNKTTTRPKVRRRSIQFVPVIGYVLKDLDVDDRIEQLSGDRFQRAANGFVRTA